MKTRIIAAIALSSILTLALGPAAPAQYIANFQTNIISAVTSNWSGNYVVGSNTFADVLIVNNSAVLGDSIGDLGFSAGSSNNAALITGSGSVWSNSFILYVGDSGSGNTLTITNSGIVYDSPGFIGNNAGANNNAVTVTGSGSVWINTYYLYVGSYGSGNTLTMANGGDVYDINGYVGWAAATNNAVTVTGVGSVWNNSGTLNVGYSGSGNTLTIANGGAVSSANFYVGYYYGATNNAVTVTGVGSVWNNSGTLNVGNFGSGNTLTITNSGTVFDGYGLIGANGAANNAVTVTGAGSVWSNSAYLYVGNFGSGNTLTITNSGTVFDGVGFIGYNSSANNNAVTVTGTGSFWNNTGSLNVGYTGFSNTLTIANGGQVVNSNGFLGYYSSSSNNIVLVTGPGSVWSNSGNLYVGNGAGNQLTVTNSGAVFANNLDLGSEFGQGTLTLAGGTVNIAGLSVGSGGIVFEGGTLISSGTVATNAQTFVVGDGTDAATFQLNGGTHFFDSGLRIRNNASLAGCGTVNGNVVVDLGGSVLANCGGALSFTGPMTNNGAIAAVSGTAIDFFGLVVNNGVINATNGGAQFYGGIVNSGTILTGPETNSWTDGTGKWETGTNWSRAAAPSITDLADLIANAGSNTVTIDAVTAGSFPATMTISNLLVSANTLSLTNAGTNVALRVANLLTLTNGAALLITNATLAVTNTSHTALFNLNSGTVTLLPGGTILADQLTNTFGNFNNLGGTLLVGGPANVDQGTQTVASGTTTISSNLLVGGSVGSTGTVNVTGGTLTVTNSVFAVGNDGTLFGTGGVGHVTVSSGLVAAVSILIGDQFGNDSSFRVTSNGHVRVTGGFRSNGIKTTLIDGGTLEIVDGPPPPFEDPALNDRIVVSYLGDGRMIVSNGTVVGLEMVVGLASGQGTFEMAGGSVNLSSNLLVGMTSTATGVVTITGGSVSVTNGVFGVGNDGTVGSTGGVAHVAVSDGVVNAASILIGDSFGSDSSFAVSSNGHVVVHGGLRSNGIKTTTINGGTLEIVDGPPPPSEDPALHDRIVVSYLGDGRMIVSNGTVVGLEMVVGLASGQGTFEMAGGTVSLSSNLLVGMSSTATGVVTMTGGSLAVLNGVLGVGNDGTAGGTGGVAHVTVTNSALVDVASVLVGDTNGCDCGLTVADGGYVRAHGGLRSNGIKTTMVTGGTLEVVDGPAELFEDPILFDSIVVSYQADGKLVVSNGTVRTPGMIVGASPGNTGTLVLAGGTASVFSNMTVGFVACSATGIVTVGGGNLYVTNGTGTAVLDVRSGTFTVSSGGYVLVDKLVVTSACARVVHTGGQLIYSQLVLDPNQSAVGDGIANGWKQWYGLDPFDANLGNKDADGVGMSNLQKYGAGFNPTNPAAYLRVISVARVNTTNINVTYLGASGDSTYVPGIATRTNVLEFTTGTANGSYSPNNFASTGQTNILSGGTGLGTVTNMIDVSGATSVPSRYYRVRVLVP